MSSTFQHQPYPATCLSEKPHDHRVSDATLHFTGCLPIRKRKRFFDALPAESQRRIVREQERIDSRRSRLETVWQDTTAGTCLQDFKAAMSQWSQSHGRRSPYDDLGGGGLGGGVLGSRRPSTMNDYFAFASDSGDVDAEIKAPVIFFKDGKPFDAPGLEGSFPCQKITVKELLADDPARNPLMQARKARSSDGGASGGDDDDNGDDIIRYFHLPANNMVWVEEAMARYYHEKRPDPDDLFMLSRMRHVQGSSSSRTKTRTEQLLRPECWSGQRNFDDSAEVHARHMRPFCDVVSVDPEPENGSDPLQHSNKNLVLFMPYLHWETDRGRLKTAAAIKEAGKQKNLLPLAEVAEVVREAQHQQHQQQHQEGGGVGYQQQDADHHQHHHGHHDSLSRKPTHASTTADKNPPNMLPPLDPATMHDPATRRRLLGILLFRAASLLEALEFQTEEQLIAKYLHARPPLQPRRTLDQSYYGALKSTGTRDRDQVVYRGTMPEPHSSSTTCQGAGWGVDEDGEPEPCSQCRDDARKVPRLLMVDQLWLWVLDGKTVVSAFPRRWGRIRPDPSAVHKSIRARLRGLRDGEVSSAWDLALMIADECSRVFFDRTKTNDRQPNLVELFAGAIRGVTYKQTAAFDQFLIYTHLASREYSQSSSYSADADYYSDGGRGQSGATNNTLLSINPEGNLLKEVKDVMDEIHIMARIKAQQQLVLESLVRHVRMAMAPKVRAGSGGSISYRGHGGGYGMGMGMGMGMGLSSWDSVLAAATSTASTTTSFGGAGGGDASGQQQQQNREDEARRRRERNVQREATRARWTLGRADHLLQDGQDRMMELNTLLENARITSTALKDLLTLKQQQAGVIEAREAVKQAALTLKQGQSIMIFTIVTIIFLPLSFFATLFGMNSVEFNDGHIPLHDELVLMLPISFAIILLSITLAFSRSALGNSFVALIRSSVSFVLNTAVTWVLVKSGLHALGRSAAISAGRLRDREAAVTGNLKAEEMRRRANVEKMRAARAVRTLTMKSTAAQAQTQGGGGAGDGASTGMLSAATTPLPFERGGGVGVTSGAFSPYSPYSPGPSSSSAPVLGVDGLAGGSKGDGYYGGSAGRGGLAIQMREMQMQMQMHDVELGHGDGLGGHRKTSSQLGLVSRR